MTGKLSHGSGPLVPAAALLLIASATMAQQDQRSAGPGGWRIAGHDLGNSRHQPSERRLGPSNVGQLVQKWVFAAGGELSATPTVAGNAVYFPDWAGNLYAVRADSGQLLWKTKISDYNGRPGSVSRVSPAIYQDQLIIGDNVTEGAHDGAHVMAIDRSNGELRWITTVDDHPAAIITGSPVFDGTRVYVGVSSNEEDLATNPDYHCCTFRGSMVALDAVNGTIVWKTFTSPDNEGQPNAYSGNAIWSPPALDPRRGVLYIGTGNNYTVPDSVLECQQQAIDSGNANAADCAAPDDYFDSVLALDLASGTIRWSRRLSGFDAWTVACLSQPAGANCPSPAGPDFDFPGSGPNLLGDLVGIGQKSGIYWALDPDDGSVVWSRVVGPGGVTGGIQWGTATDGTRIYAAITNSGHERYTLANGGPTIDWGSWAALDPSTGRILWQVPDPTRGAVDPGALSVANGVVYAGSYSGSMYGLDARNGRVLFSFASGGSVIGAPSIVNGTLYWGSGYSRIPPGITNNKMFAFGLPAADGAGSGPAAGRQRM